MQRYDSLEEFYSDPRDGIGARRDRSPESDYGVHWRLGGSRASSWRVSYVRATGEVYATRAMRGHDSVLVLGVVPPDPVDESVPYDRRASYYRTLDDILAGWAETDHDLGWVIGRLAPYQGEPCPK